MAVADTIPDWLENLRLMIVDNVSSEVATQFQTDLDDSDPGNRNLEGVKNEFALHCIRIISKGRLDSSVKSEIDDIILLHENARDNGEDTIAKSQWDAAKNNAKVKKNPPRLSDEVLECCIHSADIDDPTYIADMAHAAPHSAEDNASSKQAEKDRVKAYDDIIRELLRLISKSPIIAVVT